MKLLHIYPASMGHIVPDMKETDKAVFSEHENTVILICGTANTTGLKAMTDADFDEPILQPHSLVTYLIRNRYDYVIFHSAFWPKFWFLACFSLILRRKTIWICWGGDLPKSRGINGTINNTLKSIAISHFHRNVFISKSDAQLAEIVFGKQIKTSVITYYNPKHAIPVCSSRSKVADDRQLRVQIGNDASEINDHFVCIKQLARLQHPKITVVYPLGYGRHNVSYVESLKKESLYNFPCNSEFIDELLELDQFDKLINSCDALLLGSRGQRALYNIRSYLIAGKPVFLPKDSDLRQDLLNQGFAIEALEDFETFTQAEFTQLCSEVNAKNMQIASNVFGLDGIREKWRSVLK